MSTKLYLVIAKSDHSFYGFSHEKEIVKKFSVNIKAFGSMEVYVKKIKVEDDMLDEFYKKNEHRELCRYKYNGREYSSIILPCEDAYTMEASMYRKMTYLNCNLNRIFSILKFCELDVDDEKVMLKCLRTMAILEKSWKDDILSYIDLFSIYKEYLRKDVRNSAVPFLLSSGD